MYRVLDQQGIASDLQSQKIDIPEGCDLEQVSYSQSRKKFYSPG